MIVGGSRGRPCHDMPPGFSILDADVDLWMPVGFSEESRKPEGRWLTVVARLRDQASLTSAQADMHVPLPVKGETELDFNRAYNPPCAFTEFATCPLPPKQNWLKVKVEAGEKAFGHH